MQPVKLASASLKPKSRLGACPQPPGVWLHRGRPWPLTEFQPAHTADSFPRAVKIILATRD